MNSLYRGPSRDASYQVLFHLPKRFQRRRFFFRNQRTRNKDCLWWLCLLMDRNKMSNLYRWTSINTSYQVSVHFAKRFQRGRFLEIDISFESILHDLFILFLTHIRIRGMLFNTTFNNMSATSRLSVVLVGGGNRRKPPTCRIKLLKITNHYIC